MFSKAKRFDSISKEGTNKSDSSNGSKEKTTLAPILKPKKNLLDTPNKIKVDVQSQCSSASSVKSFVPPQPMRSFTATRKITTSQKKSIANHSKNNFSRKPEHQSLDDIVSAQEVEIRNKDQTISEYNKQIEELKYEIAKLHQKLSDATALAKMNNDIDGISNHFHEITLFDKENKELNNEISDEQNTIEKLKQDIRRLELLCAKLEKEVSGKQLELRSLEEVIVIRDSLCQDLQNKLNDKNTCLEETKHRLEMVKGHHALALEANESIRKEYKTELESLKTKMDEEKQTIINKSKTEQENIKSHYKSLINTIKQELVAEKGLLIAELKEKLTKKEQEMKAKLEQIEETTHEKLKISEIQYEERSKSIQEHLSMQEIKIQSLESEIKDLKYKLNLTEDYNKKTQNQLNHKEKEIEALNSEKLRLVQEFNQLKDESKKASIDYENKINKLKVEVEKVKKEKNKFEMSLFVTRDIVQVLTMRLRESDAELEHLEAKVQSLTTIKESMESELITYKNTLDNTILECNEYKDALVNVLKSKAALAKEHTRIMEHNVTLIESLQNVEKEAYRELGTIKTELIEDVELLKKESNTQIQMLRQEVEKKRMLCELATEHAGQATAAAEQSRGLLSHAANEISRLEAENNCLQKQIQDQQSLVVELSLLRQENEELSMMMAKQSSVMDTMKKEMEQTQIAQKSPSLGRKIIKIGKENFQTVVSPLRERNH